VAGIFRPERFSSAPAFSFADLEHKARAYLDKTHAEARQILAQAEAEARKRAARIEAAARPRAVEQGRREGLEQARREARKIALHEARDELARLRDAVTQALGAFDDSKRRLLAIAERGMLELALAVARRVCKRVAGASSEAARANARALLEMVKHEADLQIHLNPAECESLRQALPELVASAEQLAHVEIVSDAKVPRGGCLLHSRNGTIDAALESQLERVSAALLQGTTKDALEQVEWVEQ
jgi:flagellar assembly protein FliH